MMTDRSDALISAMRTYQSYLTGLWFKQYSSHQATASVTQEDLVPRPGHAINPGGLLHQTSRPLAYYEACK